MARKPMVTRTIITTKVNVLCMDVVKCEPFNVSVVLPRTYKDDKKLFASVAEQVDNETIKAVHVVAKEEIETLYGMSEQDFIKNAVVLNPETRRPYDEAEADEAEADEAEADEAEADEAEADEEVNE